MELLSHISDKKIRSLMLSIEYASEKVLIAYEKADKKTRENLLKLSKTQRTYDYDSL